MRTKNQTSSETIKTLIVGGGVAGMTLAALLFQRGEQPVVIERESKENFNHSGYMLGMMPLGGRVLNALHARETYKERSLDMKAYQLFNDQGKKLKEYDTRAITDTFGDYQGISRPELISLLQEYIPAEAVRFGTTVKAIDQTEEEAQVTFSDGSKESFDLVVIADGIHSSTRGLVFSKKDYPYYQTNWGGWVTWIDAHEEIMHNYREYWMAGHFLGLYPVKDKIGVFMGGPEKDMQKKGPKKVAQEIAKKLKKQDQAVQEALQSYQEENAFFFWDFHDGRAKNWQKDRVILLGDAAAGFLPTAGVGASMAMDSAAALNDELSRADKDHLPYALTLFEKRQRPRVEKAQQNSRQLGKMMFVKSPLLAKLRNQLLRFYTLEQFVKDIKKVMEGN